MKAVQDLIATLDELDGRHLAGTPREWDDDPLDFTEALEFLRELERLTYRMDNIDDLRRALEERRAA